MKTLYFDCSSGISGNMTIAALMELLEDKSYLENELKKIKVPGYHLAIDKRNKNGIMATHVDVVLESDHDHGHEHSHDEGHSHNHDHDHGHSHSHDHGHDHNHDEGHSHDHDHGHSHSHDEAHGYSHDHGHGPSHDEGHSHSHSHDHEHRNLASINALIDGSELDEKTKDLAKRIFLRVAKAESKVHGKPLDEVHFHEVGAIDSIIDIVASAILVNKIAPDAIYASTVNDGHGFVNCAHGLMSVPVPATSEIFAASDVVYRQIDIEGELVTPTGAAIIAELAQQFGPMPSMKVTKIGWGCGTKDFVIPNVLKVSLGDMADVNPKIVVMETNIDDTTGEILGFTMERLFQAGALDVFFTPIFMKKNRPAYRLSVACLENMMEALKDIIFKETTTIGIRYRFEDRFVLNREIVTRATSLGPIHLKVTRNQEHRDEYYEFEDLKRIALEKDMAIKDVIGILNKELSK